MTADLRALAEKIKAHHRLANRAHETQALANRRINKLNEAIIQLGIVTIDASSRGVTARLQTTSEQETARSVALSKQVRAMEVDIIEALENLLAEAYQRENETRTQLAAVRSRLDDISRRLGGIDDHVTGQDGRLDSVDAGVGNIRQTVQYLISVVNPVRKAMAENITALHGIRVALETPATPARAVRAEVSEAALEEAEPPADLPTKLVAVMFAANAEGHDPVALDVEIRDIQNQLAASKLEDLVQFEPCPATRVTDLFDRLNKYSPRLVHFSGHGTAEGILLSTPGNLAKPVAPSDLIGVVHATLEVSPVILFNICDSAGFAQQAAEHAEVAIGMAGPISDAAARMFTTRFYGAIASGRSVRNAFGQSVGALREKGFPDAGYPQMFHRPDVDPARIWLVAAASGT